jgi:zinc transport system substrate-binding protein
MNPLPQPTNPVPSICGKLILALLLTFTMAGVNAAPMVAATIKPLYLIAVAVTDGISTPSLVLGPGQDPHEFALRPSERRSLEEAEVLLWTGPSLEQPLVALVSSLDAVVITLQDATSLHPLETDLGIDPHLWLSPQAATGIAGILARSLAELDRDNSAKYLHNLEIFTNRMTSLREQLASVFLDQQQTWVVDHYAYRYFVEDFGLPQPLVLRESDNRQPGMRTVARLRQAMADAGIECIVAEPGVNADELRTMLGIPDLQVSHADPLGQTVSASPEAFAQLLENVAGAIAACMGMTRHE